MYLKLHHLQFTIQAMVQKMRQQRMAICQTSGQYGFVYSTAIKQLTSAVEAIDKRTNAAASESLYMNLPPNKYVYFRTYNHYCGFIAPLNCRLLYLHTYFVIRVFM